MPLASDFFGNVPESDGRHRPLYALPAYLIQLVFRNITQDGSLISGAQGWLNVSESDLPAALAWLTLNGLAAVATAITAATAAKMSGLHPRVAALVGLLAGCSTELFAWANHAMINSVSVWAIYFMWLLLALLFRTRFDPQWRQLLLGVALIIGVLMLGKAEYYVVVFASFWILVLTRSLFSVVIFITGTAAPLLVWIAVLEIGGSGYANYEIERSDYSIVEFWTGTFMDGGFSGLSERFLFAPVSTGLASAYIGLGVISTYAIVLFIGSQLRNFIGWLSLTYFLSAIWFLTLANFWMPRHAYEIAPLAYVGLATGAYALWTRGLPLNVTQDRTQGGELVPITHKAVGIFPVLGKLLAIVIITSVLIGNLLRADLQI